MDGRFRAPRNRGRGILLQYNVAHCPAPAHTIDPSLLGSILFASIGSMSEPKPRVVCIGEAMIEFVRGGDGRFGLGCAGDTFNVAVYLARAGIDAAFATAL